jgi:hypothetical protein
MNRAHVSKLVRDEFPDFRRTEYSPNLSIPLAPPELPSRIRSALAPTRWMLAAEVGSRSHRERWLASAHERALTTLCARGWPWRVCLRALTNVNFAPNATGALQCENRFWTVRARIHRQHSRALSVRWTSREQRRTSCIGIAFSMSLWSLLQQLPRRSKSGTRTRGSRSQTTQLLAGLQIRQSDKPENRAQADVLRTVG